MTARQSDRGAETEKKNGFTTTRRVSSAQRPLHHPPRTPIALSFVSTMECLYPTDHDETDLQKMSWKGVWEPATA